jgi:hypothetical protein
MENKVKNKQNSKQLNILAVIRSVSWLGMLNKLLFQWFFVRLTRCQEKRIENYTLHSFDLMIDGNMSSRGVGETKTYQWYSFQYWILPLTGWKSDFVYLNKKPKFIRVSKEHCV